MVLDFFGSLDLGQNEVDIRQNPHASPRLVVIGVFLDHQFHGLCRQIVVQLHGLVDGNILVIGVSESQLNDSHDTVVDDSDKLRHDTFSDSGCARFLQLTDPLGLDKQLIGNCFGAHDTP